MSIQQRPLKNLSWNDKVKNKFEWFHQWSNYLTGTSMFDGVNTTDRKDYAKLYRIYNNHFPGAMFENVIDPLKAKDPKHKNFPAKLRPINYLRTNIDLLLGEFLQRPIKFQVKNRGGLNLYMESLNSALQSKLSEIFDTVSQGGEVEVPDMVAFEQEHKASFRDKMAIRAQRKLSAAVKKYRVKSELVKCKKDYLITGEAYTFKTILPNGEFRYHRVSPLSIDYDRSTIHSLVNKSDWVVARYQLSPSEVTDMFYDSLKEKDYKQLDALTSANLASQPMLFNYFNGIAASGKINVHHCQWRARKKVLIVTGFDDETLQPYTFEADEDYLPTSQETTEEQWRTEIYEDWKINENIHVGERALPLQKDLSYNGRVYSDTHAPSMSVMEMGLPIQALIMIVTWKIELTIMQSKGKIVQIDRKAIPRTDGWTDERFFYQSEAKGYMVLDRSQQGVDKSWNQFHVLDLTLFEHLKQLIDLSEYLKQSWDDLLGIARQRKAQTAASDAVGTTNTAMIQSNIITDMIFYTFEELIEDDLKGLNELNRVADSWGVGSETWMMDDFDRELASIDPIEASLEDMDLTLEYNTDEQRKLQEIKSYLQAFLQNQGSMSAVVDTIMADTVAEVRVKIQDYEAKLQQQAQQGAQSEQELQAKMMELEKEKAEFLSILDTDFMNAEYDRKEDIEMIKGDYSTLTFQDGDSNDNGIPDADEVQKRLDKRQAEQGKMGLKREQMAQQDRNLQATLKEQRENRKSQEKLTREKIKADKDKTAANNKAKVAVAKKKASTTTKR